MKKNNKNKDKEDFANSDFGFMLGLSLVILAVFLGFGGCVKLVSGEKQSKDELIIKDSFNNEKQK